MNVGSLEGDDGSASIGTFDQAKQKNLRTHDNSLKEPILILEKGDQNTPIKQDDVPITNRTENIDLKIQVKKLLLEKESFEKQLVVERNLKNEL